VTADLVAVAGALDTATQTWERAVFAGALPTHWTGPAADAARASLARLVDRGGDLLDRARRLAAVVADVAAHPLDPTQDARLTAALAAAGRPGPGAVGAPREGPEPAGVAHWWSGLDDDERARLTAQRPDLVGGLDGVPATDRDRANRQRLTAARDEAVAQEAALDAARDRASGFGDLQEIEVRLAEVHGRLGRLTAIEQAVDTGPGHALLDLDPTSGRAAVASGDVDHAAHIGVFVPGFTSRAEDLPERVPELDGLTGPDTAVIAWYDYAAPQWSEVADPARSVLGTGPASAAADRLASFLTGLDAARPGGPAHVTAVGHSYGTLTVAQALPAARGVDDVVLLGCPGVTPAPARPGHVWLGEARGDAVADTGWFGPDPSAAPGARMLATGPEPARTTASGAVLPATAGVRGHDHYLTPGSTSAQGVAAVIGGRPGAVVEDPTAGAGDRLRGLLGGSALRPGS
jgi:hypothetical protein